MTRTVVKINSRFAIGPSTTLPQSLTERQDSTQGIENLIVEVQVVVESLLSVLVHSRARRNKEGTCWEGFVPQAGPLIGAEERVITPQHDPRASKH